MLSVTADSTVLEREMTLVREASAGLPVEILPTTVTLREHKKLLPSATPVVAVSGVYDESVYDSGAVYADEPQDAARAIPETMVLDQSMLGFAVLGDDDAPARFEQILRIISDGSFPKLGRRDNLTEGETHQLRDAMVLEAHARERRDVLISGDRTAFIGKDGVKRTKLEALCNTRILTVDEFCENVASLVQDSG
jgi:hypothetical protein